MKIAKGLFVLFIAISMLSLAFVTGCGESSGDSSGCGGGCCDGCCEGPEDQPTAQTDETQPQEPATTTTTTPAGDQGTTPT